MRVEHRRAAGDVPVRMCREGVTVLASDYDGAVYFGHRILTVRLSAWHRAATW